MVGMFGKGAVSGVPKAEPLSGAELMLRSMGLGEVIVAAKAFANANTMQKIMAFADAVGPISETITRIDARLARIERVLQIEDGSIDRTALLSALGHPAQSGSDADDSEPGGLSGGDGEPSPVEYRTAG